MILDVADCSLFERCPKLPGLRRRFEPSRFPVRDVVKEYFKSGVRAIFAGESPAPTVWRFTDEAAGRGYVYPDGEPYTLAQDFAVWLDGSLRLVQELGTDREQLPLARIGSTQVHVDAWKDSVGVIHIYRAVSSLGNQTPRWAELAVAAFNPESEIIIHQFHLPQARNGRVHSPLSIGYQHPKVANAPIRLARLDKENNFRNTWKKIGRWELPDISWAEWREGIDKDQCMGMIQEEFQGLMLDESEARALKGDLERMAVVMEKPDIWPRFREACQGCVYRGLCHPTRDSIREYVPLKDEEE